MSFQLFSSKPRYRRRDINISDEECYLFSSSALALENNGAYSWVSGNRSGTRAKALLQFQLAIRDIKDVDLDAKDPSHLYRSIRKPAAQPEVHAVARILPGVEPYGFDVCAKPIQHIEPNPIIARQSLLPIPLRSSIQNVCVDEPHEIKTSGWRGYAIETPIAQHFEQKAESLWEPSCNEKKHRMQLTSNKVETFENIRSPTVTPPPPNLMSVIAPLPEKFIDQTIGSTPPLSAITPQLTIQETIQTLPEPVSIVTEPLPLIDVPITGLAEFDVFSNDSSEDNETLVGSFTSEITEHQEERHTMQRLSPELTSKRTRSPPSLTPTLDTGATERKSSSLLFRGSTLWVSPDKHSCPEFSTSPDFSEGLSSESSPEPQTPVEERLASPHATIRGDNDMKGLGILTPTTPGTKKLEGLNVLYPSQIIEPEPARLAPPRASPKMTPADYFEFELPLFNAKRVLSKPPKASVSTFGIGDYRRLSRMYGNSRYSQLEI